MANLAVWFSPKNVWTVRNPKKLKKRDFILKDQLCCKFHKKNFIDFSDQIKKKNFCQSISLRNKIKVGLAWYFARKFIDSYLSEIDLMG